MGYRADSEFPGFLLSSFSSFPPMSWSHPVPILIPSVVKNVLSGPTPGFPVFHFPHFIFSADVLVQAAFAAYSLSVKLKFKSADPRSVRPQSST